jgi:hypothetical protein
VAGTITAEAPPPIGRAAWDRELAALGADRATVDRELRLAVGNTAEPDGHDVDLNDPSPLTAAVLVLFHQERPSYSVRAALVEATTRTDADAVGLRDRGDRPAVGPPGQFPAGDDRHRRRPLALVAPVRAGPDGRARGRLAHWSFPFRPDYEHRTLPGRLLDRPHLHRIECPPPASSTGRGAVAGLRECLARRR